MWWSSAPRWTWVTPSARRRHRPMSTTPVSNRAGGRSSPAGWCIGPRDRGVGSGADGADGFGGGHLLGAGLGDKGQSRLGQDVQAEVAALLGPLVVLLGQHRADEA